MSQVLFSVKDTGIVIAPDKTDTLFESYKQADISTARNYGGTGLGLTISKKLVEMMGGTIGVESKPGKGSKFRFNLPLKSSNNSENAWKMPLPEILKSLQVLIVDAHPEHNLQIHSFFSAWNIPADIVTSGGEALRVLASGKGSHYGIIIIDHLLFSYQGKPLVKLLRDSLHEGSTPEFVIMTDDKSIHSIRQIQSEDIRFYLFKPVLQKELRSLIQRIYRVDFNLPSLPDIASTDTPASYQTRKLNILLAEDQLINQKIVVQLLAKKGWDVVTAVNGAEAVKKTRETAFDLILMDVMMPEMDGFDATRAIRSDNEGKNRMTPIIALTANAMKGDREKCIEAGMDDYISKPLHPEDVFGTIEKYCYK